MRNGTLEELEISLEAHDATLIPEGAKFRTTTPYPDLPPGTVVWRDETSNDATSAMVWFVSGRGHYDGAHFLDASDLEPLE